MAVAAIIPYISLALTAYGTYSAIDSAKTQENQLKANANYAAEQGAADAAAAKGAAQVEADRIRKQGTAQRAQATAAAAASGIDVSSPTAVKIDDTITGNAEQDALTTIMNGNYQSQKIGAQGTLTSNVYKMNAQNASQQATASLISGVNQGYQGWKRASTGSN